MSTIYVSNASQLSAALARAAGGETIVLSSGNYGALDISGESFSSYVTLVSEEERGAVFTSVNIRNTDYLRIDNVHVDSPNNGGAASTIVSVSDGSSHIQFLNSEVNGKVDGVYSGHYGLHTSGNVSDVTFAGNYVHDIKIGGVFYNAKDLTVSGNTIDYTGADSLKFIGVQDVLIEGNMGSQNFFPAPGEHLDFIQFQGSDSSDIVIRGNVSLPGTHANVQGIFFDDAHYTNVLVEDNVIATGMIRGISVSSGTNFVARNNTLINLPGEGSKATKVMGADQSYGNIQTSFLQDAGKDANLTLQNTDPDKPFYFGDFFANPEAGLGMTLDDLLPTPNTLAETMGAVRTIEAFLAGNIQTQEREPETGQNSAPTPEPTPEQPAPTPVPTPEQPVPTPEGDTGGTDQGQIDTSLDGVAYASMGAHEFNSASDVIEVAHNSNLALDAATISLSFNADTVSGARGLISKDATYYTGGGNHLVSYIENGALIVRFQDGATDEIARIGGIKADTDYDLQVSFGDGNASVWLNGEQVHSADFSTSWATNVEYLQFGARGWSSKSGEAGFSNVFDGTISDIVVAEGNLTPAQLQNLLSDASADSGTAGGTPTPESPPTGIIANVVYEQAAEQTFNGRTASIVNLEHNAAYEVQEGTISFTFNADDLNGTQGLFSKDAFHYVGGGNHVSVMLKGDTLYLRYQDEDSEAAFRAPGIKAGEDYDVQTWFGDGEVGLAVNGELIGTKAFDVDLSLNNQNLQFGGLGWSSSDGGDQISNAFDGTISDILIVDQAVTIDHGDLIA
ncbi:hypothetical protein ACSSVY_004109 [Roseovarius sp. MBR-51]